MRSHELLEKSNIFYDTREEESKYINRHKVDGINESLADCIGYVFFTRPQLNLKDASTGFLRDIQKFGGHRSIIDDLSGKGSHSFINPISNRCKSFNTADDSLKTIETMKTFRGWSIMYAKNLDESKGKGTVSFSFKENRFLDIYYYHKIWCEYASAVYNGAISPKDYFIDYGIVDYAVSAYYFLVESSGIIRFYSKYSGLFPLAVPNSAFGYTEGNSFNDITLSVPYQYAMKDDNNPIILEDFNAISKGGGKLNKYNTKKLRESLTWCSGVKVKYGKNGPYLQFYD